MGSPGTTLPFHNLSDKHYGVTRENAAAYTQAACVCLDRHHSSPVAFTLTCPGREIEVECAWEATDARTKGAWANEIDTTEAGAYAFAIAGVEVAEGLFAVHRAETGTGADYYLAERGTHPDDLEECTRLEVSGVDRGSIGVVRRRLNEKVAQASRGKSSLPALAAVVGFKEKVILIERVEVP